MSKELIEKKEFAEVLRSKTDDELNQEFDQLNRDLEGKDYSITLDVHNIRYVFEDFFPNVKWKGYESYGVDEVHKALQKEFEKPGMDEVIDGFFKYDIVEALFHFLKVHEGNGLSEAKNHRALSDQVAKAMAELNEDRKKLQAYGFEINRRDTEIDEEKLISETDVKTEASHLKIER